jgi:hypothetical protein
MSKETKTVSTGAKDQTSHAPQVFQALDTLAQVILGGELQTLRQSIGDLDAKTVERVEAVRKELSDLVAGLKNDFHRASAETRLKLSEAEENQQKALLDLGDRTDKWIEGVKKDVQDATKSAGERIDAARAAATEQVTTQGKKLEERIESVSQAVSSLQQELRQQQESSQRFAALLNNLGAVFQMPAAPQQAQVPTPSVPESKRDAKPAAAKASAPGGENQADLDRALDEAFSRSSKS